MDTSMCHGAPVYQAGDGADGPVLYRYEYRDGRTRWWVSDSSALETCGGSGGTLHLGSADNEQPGGGPPTELAYSTGENLSSGGTGWADRDASPTCSSGCGIAVAADATYQHPPPVRASPSAPAPAPTPPARLGPLAAGFDESYTLSGCSNAAHCGIFTRVAARCTSGIDYCPGGPGEPSGSTDTSLCNGAPVYQTGGADGPVLFRFEAGSGRTGWIVDDSSGESK